MMLSKPYFTTGTTYTNQTGGVDGIYEAAQKIYHIGKESDHSDSPFAAMIFGAAQFGGSSWRNVFANFWNRLEDKSPVKMKKLVEEFMKYLRSEIPSKSKRPEAGLYLAGYGRMDPTPRCFRVDVKSLAAPEIQSQVIVWD